MGERNNYEFWAKQPSWTAREAACLLTGLDPCSDDPLVEMYHEPGTRGKIIRVLEQSGRTEFTPSECVVLEDKFEFGLMPFELRDAVARNASVENPLETQHKLSAALKEIDQLMLEKRDLLAQNEILKKKAKETGKDKALTHAQIMVAAFHCLAHYPDDCRNKAEIPKAAKVAKKVEFLRHHWFEDENYPEPATILARIREALRDL